MNTERSVEQNIKKRFESYQPQPPADLWNKLEARLPDNKKSNRKQYLGFAAAISLIFVFAWATYDYISQNISQPISIVAEDETTLEDLDRPARLESITISESINPEAYSKPRRKDPEKPVSTKPDEIIDIAQESSAVTEKKGADTAKEKKKHPKQEASKDIAEKESPTFFSPDEQTYSEGSLQQDFIAHSELTKDDKTVFITQETTTYDITLNQEKYIDDNAGDHVRWSIGANTAPQYSFRLNSSDPDELNRGKNIFEQNESHIFTYNLGLNVKYHLNEKIIIESGVYYNQMGQAIQNITVHNDIENKGLFKSVPHGKDHPQSALTSMGIINFNDPRLSFTDNSSTRVKTEKGIKAREEGINLQEKGNKISQKLGFVELPLIVRYEVYNLKTSIQLKGGVGFNYLLTNNVVLHQDGQTNKIGETSLIRNWNISINGGVAFVVPVTNHVNFHVEPTVNTFVTSMTEGREYNVYPFSFSIYTGFSIPF